MEKLSELTISDVKELTEGKKVTAMSTDDSAISVHMKNAVLIADPDAATDGMITLVETDTGCKIELDSDRLVESIHGNDNTIIIRFSNGMGGLDIEIIEDILIHPIEKAYGWKEPIHKDFVSRYEFINRTGVFVTPEHFEYIYDMEYKESGVSADEFVNNYEKKYSTCIQEVPLHGTFKYEVMDEDLSCVGLYDEIYEANIWEIVNSLAVSYASERQSRWEAVEKCKSALQDTADIIAKMQLVDKKASEYQS